MGKRQCKGTNKQGQPCGSPPVHESDYCLSHGGKDWQSVGFGGAQPGAGRPPNPKPLEIMRERVEAEVDALLEPYFRAVKGAMLYGTQQRTGEIRLSEFPDIGARINAAEKLFDRVYGKPTTQADITAAVDVNLNLVTDDELRDAAATLRRRLAAARPVKPSGPDAGDRA